VIVASGIYLLNRERTVRTDVAATDPI